MPTLNDLTPITATEIAVESEWRQKVEHELTPEQLATKRAMDQEWFDACEARAKAFLLNPDGTRSTYTKEEWDSWSAEGGELWKAFEIRCHEAGLYEEITLDDRIARAEAIVAEATAEVSRLNVVRADVLAREEAARQAEIGGKTPGDVTMPGSKGS